MKKKKPKKPATLQKSSSPAKPAGRIDTGKDRQEKRMIYLIGILLFIMLVLWVIFTFSSEAGQAYLKSLQETKKSSEGNYFDNVQSTCIDTDSLNFYAKGRVYFQDNVLTDDCQTEQELVEYYCEDNIPSIQFFGCPCENGKCIVIVQPG
ncbi:MAG: hypothetical protein V1743_00195 [Nanoarchaeota archaeon]